jgi:hypothetical protein
MSMITLMMVVSFLNDYSDHCADQPSHHYDTNCDDDDNGDRVNANDAGHVSNCDTYTEYAADDGADYDDDKDDTDVDDDDYDDDDSDYAGSSDCC